MKFSECKIDFDPTDTKDTDKPLNPRICYHCGNPKRILVDIGNKTNHCKHCNNTLNRYLPTPQVEDDGEVTVYESSLGFFPFKE